MKDDWLSKRESGTDFDVRSEATWQKNYQDVGLSYTVHLGNRKLRKFLESLAVQSIPFVCSLPAAFL